MAKKWSAQDQITKSWLKSTTGTQNAKQLYNQGLLSAPLNQQGRPMLAKATLTSAGEDAVLAGLQGLFAGTADTSQRVGALPESAKNMVSTYLPGFGWQVMPGRLKETKTESTSLFDAILNPPKHSELLTKHTSLKYPGEYEAWLASVGPNYAMKGGVEGAYQTTPSFPGWLNISAAQQNIPKIRAQFGNRVADLFSSWVENQIQQARPENKYTWKEMPQFQQDLVRQYMGQGPQTQAAPTANWGAINQTAVNRPPPGVPGGPGYLPPVTPVFAPTASGLFSGVTATPNVSAANPLQAAIQQAAAAGNIYGR